MQCSDLQVNRASPSRRRRRARCDRRGREFVAFLTARRTSEREKVSRAQYGRRHHSHLFGIGSERLVVLSRWRFRYRNLRPTPQARKPAVLRVGVGQRTRRHAAYRRRRCRRVQLPNRARRRALLAPARRHCLASNSKVMQKRPRGASRAKIEAVRRTFAGEKRGVPRERQTLLLMRARLRERVQNDCASYQGGE